MQGIPLLIAKALELNAVVLFDVKVGKLLIIVLIMWKKGKCRTPNYNSIILINASGSMGFTIYYYIHWQFRRMSQFQARIIVCRGSQSAAVYSDLSLQLNLF